MTFGHILSVALGGLAVFGIVTSTVYSLMVAASVVQFRRRAGGGGARTFVPPVSVLKPLHGAEPDLEENLTSFFEQDYPEFEILFSARHASDAGLKTARRVAARFPEVKARMLVCGDPPWPNPRTYSLETMRREARYPILVASDSDVRVGPGYLASVVEPLSDPKVGMVTCLYRGFARRGLWAQLEAMGMSVEMTSGVLVADMLEGMKFALGPSMTIRQSTIENIGGLKKVAEYYADDFVLGNWTAKAGERVELATYVVEHHVLNASFRGTIAHQQDWATSTRFSRPLGHLGEVLTYAVPYGLLGLAAMGASGHFAWGVLLLAITLMNRVLLSALVAGFVVDDKVALRKAWLYPLRDLMGFCFWIGSFIGSSRLRYRGDPYELLPHGRLRRLVEEGRSETVLAR
ncbi:MAG: glycosyltransferase [Terracidiphilus sp.]|jgi:ceramide glucosyltransferase